MDGFFRPSKKFTTSFQIGIFSGKKNSKADGHSAGIHGRMEFPAIDWPPNGVHFQLLVLHSNLYIILGRFRILQDSFRTLLTDVFGEFWEVLGCVRLTSSHCEPTTPYQGATASQFFSRDQDACHGGLGHPWLAGKKTRRG